MNILKLNMVNGFLYDPGLNKNTYILWLLPILIFLLGGAIIYKKTLYLKNKSN